jgi:hypothetical protein
MVLVISDDFFWILYSMSEKSPDWFTQAINIPYSDRWIDVDGCTIHYQVWSEHKQELPGLLFVHGHGANAHWWDFIAPDLMHQYRVAALDLSGAGDSGHRSAYSTAQFVAGLFSGRTQFWGANGPFRRSRLPGQFLWNRTCRLRYQSAGKKNYIQDP